MARSFEWDGERIKEKVNVEDRKHSPKDILDTLQRTTGQLAQAEGQLQQMEQQKTLLMKEIDGITALQKDLKPFEEKCVEIQKDKLKLYINQLNAEAVDSSNKASAAIIGKDPNAYTEDQKKNLHYVEYQKFLATNNKVAENISRGIIHKYLYETPIFENPFK
jgi:hypothetical protein